MHSISKDVTKIISSSNHFPPLSMRRHNGGTHQHRIRLLRTFVNATITVNLIRLWLIGITRRLAEQVKPASVVFRIVGDIAATLKRSSERCVLEISLALE